jgi:hypothetical protein
MSRLDYAVRADRAPPAAVTNGRRTFVVGDGRGPWARRYRDLIALHVSDLGGPDAGLSEAQLSLISWLRA